MPLFTEVRGETVWKIAEGVSSTLLWRQEAADRDFFDPSWPLSEPRFGINSEFPNSFGRGVLRSSRFARVVFFSQESGMGVARLKDNPPSEARMIAECAD